ncbi:hypothetical protein C4M83_03950, partial [Mycoplasmopsis pullorum]
ASIIGGKGGVNLHTRIYSDGYSGEGDFFRKIENLILKNDCSVINTSFGAMSEGATPDVIKWYSKYNPDSSFFDALMIRKPEVLFVTSAGNNGETWFNDLLGHKLAWNGIVVGSNNEKGEMSSFSSRSNFTDRKRVTLLANGEKYYKKHDGTSFSAPFISGILSYTLQEYKNKYDLGKNNIIALAALSTSTYSLNKNNEKLSEYGAGTFDYSKLKKSFDSLQYIKVTDKWSISTMFSHTHLTKDKEMLLRTIEADKNDVIRGAIAWESEFVHKNNNKEEERKFPFVRNFDLILKDDKGNVLASSDSNFQNLEYIKFNVNKKGKYKWVLVRKQDLDFPTYPDLPTYKNYISSWRTTEIAFSNTIGKD